MLAPSQEQAVSRRVKPRFFAPDQKTPGQARKRWVQGDVFARAVDGALHVVEAATVNPDGILIRGVRIDDYYERFGPEIAAYRDRRAHREKEGRSMGNMSGNSSADVLYTGQTK